MNGGENRTPTKSGRASNFEFLFSLTTFLKLCIFTLGWVSERSYKTQQSNTKNTNEYPPQNFCMLDVTNHQTNSGQQ